MNLKKRLEAFKMKGILSLPFIIMGSSIGFHLAGDYYEAKPKQESYELHQYTVNEAYRDHNGVRAFLTDENGKTFERKYFERNKTNFAFDNEIKLREKFPPSEEIMSELNSGLDENITVLRDLKEGDKSYVNELSYNTEWKKRKMFKVEFHIAPDERIKAGVEQWKVSGIPPFMNTRTENYERIDK